MAHPAMLRKLDDVFQRIVVGDLVWSSQADFVSTLDDIVSQLPGATIDWDQGAGEEWARVFEHEELASILLVRGRFVFLHENYESKLAGLLRTREVAVHVVADWDAETFQVDKALLRRAFDRAELPSEVNYNAVSALDLWWATV